MLGNCWIVFSLCDGLSSVLSLDLCSALDLGCHSCVFRVSKLIAMGKMPMTEILLAFVFMVLGLVRMFLDVGFGH